MKTINILKTATTVLFASYWAAYFLKAILDYWAAYFLNAILDFTMFQTWVLVLIAAAVGVGAEIYWNQAPTLLKKRIKDLEKSLEISENSKIEAINEIGSRWELESELENAKATLQAQQAELDRVEIAYSKVEAKLKDAQAEISEKDLRISELEAKLEDEKAATKRWAADCSSVREAYLKSNEIIKTNNELHECETQILRANLAQAEQTLSEIHKFISEFMAKFGYGIFVRNWEMFKTFWRNPNYSTNRLNAVSSLQTQSEIMMSAEACEIFERHFFDESEVISE
jgi:hypothetical protein